VTAQVEGHLHSSLAGPQIELFIRTRSSRAQNQETCLAVSECQSPYGISARAFRVWAGPESLVVTPRIRNEKIYPFAVEAVVANWRWRYGHTAMDRSSLQPFGATEIPYIPTAPGLMLNYETLSLTASYVTNT
jgi:hypothetical protein